MLFIYLSVWAVCWIIGSGIAIVKDATFNRTFNRFLREDFFPILGIGLIVSAFWPALVIAGVFAGIPAGIGWLIWKPLHKRAKLREAVSE